MTICELSAVIFLILAVLSKADLVCVSGDVSVNQVFLGEYTLGSDGKYTSTRCDGTVNILFEGTKGKWRGTTDSNPSSAYFRCPTVTTTPDACPAGTWINGGDTDPSLSVDAGACDSNIPSISCTTVYIDTDDARCSGYFNAVENEDGLYRKDCGQADYVYFFYNAYSERWQCGPSDERDICDAYEGSNIAYMYSTDTQLDTLSTDSSPVTATLTFPSGSSAGFYCDAAPQVSCPYLEIANVGNGNDGIYEKVSGEQNLFLDEDETKYFFYRPVGGSSVTEANPLDSCDSLSASFRSSDTTFGSVSAGDVDVSISVGFPTSGTESAAISCLAEAPTPPPTEAAGENDMCVAVEQWINYGSYNWYVAGTYAPITTLNGYTAYQLYGCDTEYGSDTERYLWYDSNRANYVITTDIPTSGAYSYQIKFYGTNGATDPVETVWNYPDYVEVSAAATRTGGCGCDSAPLGGESVPMPIEEIEWRNNNGVDDGIWMQFVRMLASDRAALVLTVVFVVLCVSSLAMFAYCMGYRRGTAKLRGSFQYSKAKVVFDDQDNDM